MFGKGFEEKGGRGKDITLGIPRDYAIHWVMEQVQF